MIRRVSVDPGKEETKVTEYMENDKVVKKFGFPTKASEGDFRDDAVEKRTHILEYNGQVYKVGAGASSRGAADNKRNKISDAHKIAIITALAKIASCDEKDEFRVAIGIPAEDWCNVNTREEVRTELLPTGDITVKYKDTSTSEVVEKTFFINPNFRKVYAEGIGALLMDDSIHIPESDGQVIGVIEMGSLNMSAVVWNGNSEIERDYTITKDLGSKKLRQMLSSRLTSELGIKVNEMSAAAILRKVPAARRVVTNNGDKEIEERSRAIIKDTLIAHVEAVKNECELKDWDLDVMPIVFAGGTSTMLAEEIKEVFGQSVVIVSNAVFSNSFGYLEILCAQDDSLVIDTEDGCIKFDNVIDVDNLEDESAA